MTTTAPLGPRNILSLSSEEKRTFLDSIDHVFSDVDGVLWNLEHNIDGAAEGFKVLESVGKKVSFLTNNSVRPPESYAKKFQAIGMKIDTNDIIHPAKSIVEYLNSIKFEGLIYIIATEIFKNVLRKAGYKLIDGPNKIIEESIIEMLQNVFDSEPVRAVIIDFDFNVSSIKLMRAHNYLRHPECLLIAGATDMLLPLRKDINIIGPGSFANVIAGSTKKNVITLGKPGKALAQMLINRFNINNTHRTLMIGDMLEQDVAFGRECGFQTLVVLSGGCTRKDLDTETYPQLTPDFFAESVGDFVEFMQDVEKSN